MDQNESMSTGLIISLTILGIVALGALVVLIGTRRVVSTPTERAVHSTLHTASRAARSLRTGLSAESARDALPHLKALTDAEAVALFEPDGTVLAVEPDDTGRREPTLWNQQLRDRAARAVTTADTVGLRVLIADPCGT